MLIQHDASCLLVIDIQEKLIPSIIDHQQIINNTCWLIKLAKKLNIQMIVSEQYPKGLGKTVDAIDILTSDCLYLEKTHFSVCSNESCFMSIAKQNKKQLILVGIETHVCVMQSAIELKQKGYDVFVVSDCVSARHIDSHHLALSRMRQNGIEIVSKEMVLFEWLRDAKHEQFKEISLNFLRG